ncbi:MAG: hypothetical protein A2086_04985 [Spirochaetes bacterium GWD1_27_9]|nr:MAG: hypothetical protein A2086_04985 [Spirochaetes bacterium GWD1_27_9]
MKINTKIIMMSIPSLIISILVLMLTIVFTIQDNSKKNLEEFKNIQIEYEKIKLKNLVEVSYKIIDSNYQNFKNGLISEEEAQNLSKKSLSELRYDNVEGYFWINDTSKPIPRMIMHPIIPSLNGVVMSDRKYNNAVGRNKNLFVAFLEVCEKKGEGYVDYFWPKPTKEGLTKEEPKLSYVKLFKEWNWIIGTGVYVDKINIKYNEQELLVKKHLDLIYFIYFLVGLIAIIINCLIIFIGARKISKPIQHISKYALLISEGNLIKIDKKYKEEKSKNEIGKLIYSFNFLVTNLTNSIKEMQRISLQLEYMVIENNKTIHDMSNISSVQASAIEEISAALEESASAIKTISGNAKMSSDKLLEGSKKAEEGFDLIEKIIKSIQKISEQSGTIRNSLELIYGITEQTNLLALNASIEAAKAGESGKGFSVVASEIRKLADKSKITANEINIQIEENNKIVEEAKKLILNSQNTFRTILETTVSSRQILSEIAAAINEQAIGSSEMMSSIDNIYESSQKMVDIVESSKENQRTIDESFNSLAELIKKYRIESK